MSSQEHMGTPPERIIKLYEFAPAVMDLSVDANRDGCRRTIFEDAEYFSKRHSYKLMPITFEAVNETIIRIEHNYCRCSPRDIAESHENHNCTPHSEFKDRNYKKRKIKCLTGEVFDAYNTDSEKGDDKRVSDLISDSGNSGETAPDSKTEEEDRISQPLDLSLPLVNETKSDKFFKECRPNLPKTKSETKIGSDIKQLDIRESNKENVTAPSKKIEVTISRPGQKEFYQPCDIFLNDVARISPDLIKNDCYEIDIIDRTHSQKLNTDKFRTYYIVSESTWRIFENSKERIILTNDLDIGEPMVMKENFEKPKYLIFDQYSLAECLADFCEKKGGCFEYTCVEESKEVLTEMQERKREPQSRHPELFKETNQNKMENEKGNVENNPGEKARHNKSDIPNDFEKDGEERSRSGDTKTQTEIAEINSVDSTEAIKLGGISASENEEESSGFERFETDNGTCDDDSVVKSVESQQSETVVEKNVDFPIGCSASGTSLDNGGTPVSDDAKIVDSKGGTVDGENFGTSATCEKTEKKRKVDSNGISVVSKSRLKVRDGVKKGVRNVKNCDVAPSRKALRSSSKLGGEEMKRKRVKSSPGAAVNKRTKICLPGRKTRSANGSLRRTETGKTPVKNGRDVKSKDDNKSEESFIMTRNRASGGGSAGNGNRAVAKSGSESWKRRSGGDGSEEDGAGFPREESKLRSGKRRCSSFEKGKGDGKGRNCRRSKAKDTKSTEKEEIVKRKSARLRKNCFSNRN